jgi:hypothetical protein
MMISTYLRTTFHIFTNIEQCFVNNGRAIVVSCQDIVHTVMGEPPINQIVFYVKVEHEPSFIYLTTDRVPCIIYIVKTFVMR